MTVSKWWLAGKQTKPTTDGVGMTQEDFTQGRHDHSTRRSKGASQNGRPQQRSYGMSQRRALHKVQAVPHACMVEVLSYALQRAFVTRG